MDLHIPPSRNDGAGLTSLERPGRRNFFQLTDPQGEVCLAVGDEGLICHPACEACGTTGEPRGLCPLGCAHLSLMPGITLYTGCFHCPVSKEYGFEVTDDHVSLSYCTEGQSSTEMNLGGAHILGITQTPATCTASYLPQVHGYWRPLCGVCRLITLRLNVTRFEQLCGQLRRTFGRGGHDLPPVTSPFFIGAPATPALMMAASGLEDALAQEPRLELLIQCKALELTMLILAQLHQNQSTPLAGDTPLSKDDVENLRAARDILRDNLSDPPSLTQLARRAGINEFKLKRGFRRLFGVTPYGFLREERLEQARRHLESGEMNVYEACLAVGYSNPGHFSGAFKRRFGVSPGGVRQSALRGSAPAGPASH